MTKRILVLERGGEPSLVCRALETAGDLVVQVARDTTETRAVLAAAPVDCVLVHLPGEFDTALRDFAAELAPRTPIVVLGDSARETCAIAAIARGPDDYLVAETTSPDVIVLAVRHAIERRAHERALRERDAQFAVAVEALQEGVVIHDREGKLLQSNAAAARMLGYAPRTVAEMHGGAPQLLVRADGTPLPPEEHPSRQVFLTGHSIHDAIIGVVQSDGATRWLSINALAIPATGDAHVVTTLVDVTEQRRAHEALEQMTLRDPLTKLPNRALLCDRIDQALGRATIGQIVALIAVDVDGFNSVNDSYGFTLGDEVLCTIAARLTEEVPTATVGRVGADTFGVLLEGFHHVDEVVASAQRLAQAASGSFTIGKTAIYLRSSAGVATASTAATAETLLRNADLALHRAKGAGGGHTVVFEDRDLAALRDRLALEHDLRIAVELGEITLAYQPIVRTDDGCCVGCEVLARWNHPVRGAVPPEIFIAAADAIGALRQLTEHVVKTACTQIVRWQRAGVIGRDFRIGINLAATDLANQDIVTVVADALAQSGLDPSCVFLEVTETALVRDTDGALEALVGLRRLGVHVSLDDFGTGYSSLAYLEKFPIDAVKIDKSFVAGLGRDPEATTLVRGIVSLARGLGLVTIGEGVETGAQLEALRQLGCPLSQGYLWSRPASAELFPDVVSRLQDGARTARPRDAAAAARPRSMLAADLGWAVLDSLPTAVALLDTDGTIIGTNLPWQRAALANDGDATACGVGANYLNVCDAARGEGADTAALSARGIRAVLSGGRDAFMLEYPCNSPTEERQFLLVATPIAGRIGHAVVAHFEITARHLAERALADSRRRFQSLLEYVPLGIYRLDASSRIVDVNPALCRIVGRPAEELYGERVDALFADGCHAEDSTPDGQPRGAGPSTRTQRLMRRVDGEMRVVQVTDVVVPDDEGGETHVATVEDVTDRLRLEDELRRAQEMEALGRLAAGIAHEINTPTQFIADNLTFLSESWPAVAKVLSAAQTHSGLHDTHASLVSASEDADLPFVIQEVPAALEQSLEGVERVASIVRAMKAFGHPDSSDPEIADINEIVRNTVTVARNETKYVAELELELGDVPRLACYPGSLGQALLNLIVNAAHAVAETNSPGRRGHILIATEVVAGWATISVTDSGPGIPDDVLPHIFKPFFTTKPVGEGTGQGLALAWSAIVERHRGRIDVDSTSEGARFAIAIPLTPATAQGTLLARASA